MKPRPKWVGMLGGTFDPPHRGHLRMAAAAERALGLERIYFIPAAHPWHKHAPGAGYEDRFAMLALALAGRPRWQPLALQDAQATYSVDQVAALRRRTGARVCFIAGADSFVTLPTWKQPERLLGMCDFLVLGRDGFTWDQILAALPPGSVAGVEPEPGGRAARLRGGHRLHWRPRFRCAVSSTAVRRWLARPSRHALSGPLPGAVAEYIRRARLYGAGH